MSTYATLKVGTGSVEAIDGASDVRRHGVQWRDESLQMMDERMGRISGRKKKSGLRFRWILVVKMDARLVKVIW
jgi:hypothetical protein